MEEGGSEERKKEDGERFSVIYRRVNQSRRTDPSLLVIDCELFYIRLGGTRSRGKLHIGTEEIDLAVGGIRVVWTVESKDAAVSVLMNSD
ncbi:unnamed protein product [Enterobius vermicularis]|uniref:PH domain-containing protein n=1 Tax=Enterobius vermicularis TaxID=51028 RepID=A0A0N4VBR1_ENTVE|nr:unnamed protein product [Enterobius vermicularis]